MGLKYCMNIIKNYLVKKNNSLRTLRNKSGNLSIIATVVIFLFFISLISLIDIFQLYTAREHTKNASDAIALAAAQNLLFFEEYEISEIVKKIGDENCCEVDSIEINYDEIIVTTVKRISFMFWGRIFKKNNLIYSTSKVKVIYPWDEKFKNCRSFSFDY